MMPDQQDSGRQSGGSQQAHKESANGASCVQGSSDVQVLYGAQTVPMLGVLNDFFLRLDLSAFSGARGGSVPPTSLSKLMVRGVAVSDSRQHCTGFPKTQEIIG